MPGIVGGLCAAQSAQAQSVTPAPTVESRTQAVECLALAVAYEAGYEPVDGQQAVAEVVLNRVRSPLFPATVCGVVFAGSTRRTGCQFSFTCDGSLRRTLPASVMLAARAVAEQEIDGLAPFRVGGATHYHANYVRPYWAPSLVKISQIGLHIFYRLPGANSAAVASAALFAETGGAQPSASAPVAASDPASPPGPFAPWGLSLAAPAAP